MNNLKNSYEKLKKNLINIKFQPIPTNQQLFNENPEKFLHIIHYVLIDYKENLYKELLNKNYELFSKNDMRFMENLKEFKYKPFLNLSQFFTNNFYEKKINFLNEIIELVLERTNGIEKPKNILKISQNSVNSTIIEENSQINFSEIENLENFEDEKQEILKIEPSKPNISKKENITKNLNNEIINIDSKNEILKENNSLLNSNNSNKIENEPEKKKNKLKKQDLINLIVQLNENQQVLIEKFSDFQNKINSWMTNTTAKIFLLENDLKMIKNLNNNN